MSRVIAEFSQFFDNEGVPLADGWLKFLVSGSNNTLKDTYADVDQTIPNANPIQLDAAGVSPNIFGQGVYRVILYTNNPVTHTPGEMLRSFDPVRAEITITDSAEGNFGEWLSDYSYQVGQIVILNGLYYRSITANNIDNSPDISPVDWEEIDFLRYWNTNVTYITDNIVVYDHVLYFSRQDANIGNTPNVSPLWWSAVGSGTVLVNWEEFGTIFQPVISGYQFGSATNVIGTAYITDFGIFPQTPLSLPISDFQIANKLYVDTGVESRMRWVGDWIPGTYEEFDIVRDENWTMIANQTTDERPSPQPVGPVDWISDLFSPAGFSETSDSQPALYVGQRYILSSAYLVENLRIWVPESAIGLNMEVWGVYDPTGAFKIINLCPGIDISNEYVNRWVELPFGQLYIEKDVILDVVMVLRSPAQENNFTYAWSYERADGDPNPGQIHHQSGTSINEIRVHEQDNTLVNRTINLDNVASGSKITLVGSAYVWEVMHASKSGSIYTFIVNPGVRASSGSADFKFTYYTATALNYVYETDLYVSDSSVRGYFGNEYDGSDAAYLNDNGYGIDIKRQEMIGSDHWDVVAQPIAGDALGGYKTAYWTETSIHWEPITSGVGYLGDTNKLIQGLYLGDNNPVYFGNSQDAVLKFNGTDLNLDISGSGYFNITSIVEIDSTTPQFRLRESDSLTLSRIYMSAGITYFESSSPGSGASGGGHIYFAGWNGSNIQTVKVRYSGAWQDFWHSGNDGSLSGLDADLLDGQHGSYYAANSLVVHLDGAEDIIGNKTFIASPILNNSVYLYAKLFDTTPISILGITASDSIILGNAVTDLQFQSDTLVPFLNLGSAQGIQVGSLWVSNSYSGSAPANGIYSLGVIQSGVTTGTAPFTIASTTVNTNLNADLLDGYHADTTNTVNTVAVRDNNGTIFTQNLALGGATHVNYLDVPEGSDLTNSKLGRWEFGDFGVYPRIRSVYGFILGASGDGTYLSHGGPYAYFTGSEFQWRASEAGSTYTLLQLISGLYLKTSTSTYAANDPITDFSTILSVNASTFQYTGYNIYHAGNDSNLAKLNANNLFTNASFFQLDSTTTDLTQPYTSNQVRLSNYNTTNGNFAALLFTSKNVSATELTSAAIIGEFEDHADATYSSSMHLGVVHNGSYSNRISIKHDSIIDIPIGLTTFSSNSNFPVQITGTSDQKLALTGSNSPYIQWYEGATGKSYIQWSTDGYLIVINQEDGAQLRLKDVLDFSDDNGSTFYAIYHEGINPSLAAGNTITGSFTTVDAKTITVTNGIITAIV